MGWARCTYAAPIRIAETLALAVRILAGLAVHAQGQGRRSRARQPRKLRTGCREMLSMPRTLSRQVHDLDAVAKRRGAAACQASIPSPGFCRTVTGVITTAIKG